MSENKLGELIRKAKGEDRSLREYARESGVDAATISKIINGTYIPKKTMIYKSLTSERASPRGGVTYQQLLKAADSSKSYQAGLLAGMAATEALLSALGGMSMATTGISATLATLATIITTSKKKNSTDKAADIVNEIQRFAATSNGLLFAALAAKDISFRICKKKNNELVNQFDTYLELEDQDVKEYIFRYLYLNDEDQKIKFIVENTPKRMIEELTFLEPSNRRKVSIVTNFIDSYEYMLSYKDNLSYNGELSIILMDVKGVELIKEDYISHYSGEKTPSEIIIV